MRVESKVVVLLAVVVFALGCVKPEAEIQRMSKSKPNPSKETLRFHQVITQGDFEDLQNALKNGADVNAPGKLGMTALAQAMWAEPRDIAKVKLLIESGADPELTDDFNNTALRQAVYADFVEAARFLVGLGVDRGFNPRDPLKKIVIDAEFPRAEMEMPPELKGTMSAAEWEESLDEIEKSWHEPQENPTVEPMISDVQCLEMLRVFLEAGDELSLAPTEIKRTLVGLENDAELRVAASDFHQQRSPRFGRDNPELMDVPFWNDMIRTGGGAYSARTKFGDDYTISDVVWCYDRFGSSLTALDDGRYVQIAGEHEDFYDPDFYIYNDVVVFDGRGNFQIYSYPREIFPPTDFHTATLCLDGIYIIGCLGYPDQRRPGFTPVYRLKLDSWKIEPIQTTGEFPGWLHKHRAYFAPERNVICVAGGENSVIANDGTRTLVPNDHQFELDLSQMMWRQIK